MSFFNPFSEIIETQALWHTHVLRTTFWQKCFAAGMIYFGSFFRQHKEENHVGLFDWCTGFIPFGLLYLAHRAYESRNPFLNFVVFPLLVLVNIPFVLARLLFSLAATIVTALLIIPIVHGIAWLIEGRDLKRNAGKLTVIRIVNGRESGEGLNLENVPAVEDIAELVIQMAIVPNAKIGEHEGEPAVRIGFMRGDYQRKWYSSLLFPLNQSSIDSIPLEDKPRFDEQVSAFKSLLRLNPNQIIKDLERAPDSKKLNADKALELYVRPAIV